ncbi:MAG: ABC transporter substrate-binding protein [Bacteroidota bacterium]
MTTILNSITLVLLTLVLVAPAAAQSDGIEEMLRQRDAEIKTILGEGTPTAAQRDELRAVVNDVIDFEAMSAQALGPFWSDLSAGQQAEFAEAFGGVIRAQSLADLDLYRARVSYGDVAVTGATATAFTTARSGDVDAEVVYALARTGDAWAVTDIVIDDVSTVEGYATSFQRVMKRKGVADGFETLMASLRKRLARG